MSTPSNLSPERLRVAIVNHLLVRRGGAERVLESMADVFPQAHLFAMLADSRQMAPGLLRHPVHTSFLQKWVGLRRFPRFLMPFYPLAVESLDMTGYDLVISSESGPAKGVVTGSGTCHICYCHSPMRYLWEMPGHYRQTAPLGKLGRAVFFGASHYLRLWDLATAARVDHFIASSRNGARRIRKHYRRQAAIIYPPVDTGQYQISSDISDYYLVLCRLVSYKRVDLAIEACNRLGRGLVVVGEGEQRSTWQRLAGPTVRFTGEVSDAEARQYLSHCRALLFPGEEDIGLTPIEAQASGRPVIAFARGGALETVVPVDRDCPPEDASGVFFHQQSVAALCDAMREFETMEARFRPSHIRHLAQRFDREEFQRQLLAFVSARWREHEEQACPRLLEPV